MTGRFRRSFAALAGVPFVGVIALLALASISATAARAGVSQHGSAGGRTAAPSTVRGQVVDAEGRPLTGVAVWIYQYGNLPAGPTEGPVATTGPDGTFTLALPPGRTVTASIGRPGYLGRQVGLAPQARADAPPVEIALQREGRITGQVVDGTGRPVENARVSFQRSGYHPGDFFPVDEDPVPCPGGRWIGGVETDSAGRFDIGSLDPGWYDVGAHVAGFRPSARRTLLVAGSAGSEGPVVIRLQEGEYGIGAPVPAGTTARQEQQAASGTPSDAPDVRRTPGAAVSGRILGVAPEEAAAAQVAALCNGQPFSVHTDRDGRYRLADLPEGRCRLRAYLGTRSATASAVLRSGVETTLDFTLPPARDVRGRLVDERGRPVAQAWVRVGGKDQTAVLLSAQDGTFVLRLEDGVYWIWASQEGFVQSARKVRVGPKLAREIELRMPRGAAVSGRILGLMPPHEIPDRIEARGSGDRLVFGLPDQQGRYRVSGLSPGEWSIGATYYQHGPQGIASYMAPARRVIVRGVEEVTLDLDFGVVPLAID
jgi:protocatechuate 3,4-dioxygenase beta subunit